LETEEGGRGEIEIGKIKSNSFLIGEESGESKNLLKTYNHRGEGSRREPVAISIDNWFVS
jgi:hypothetical protein